MQVVDDANRDRVYGRVILDFNAAIDRLTAGYEADPAKRDDLRQEIHLQIWRSLEVFDERCSLRTWIWRVAHNAAVSWVHRERRARDVFVSLEDLEHAAPFASPERALDRDRALLRLQELVRKLKPLDRQIMLGYLEEMDMAAIAEVTGLSPAHVAVSIHRIRNLLARMWTEAKPNVR